MLCIDLEHTPLDNPPSSVDGQQRRNPNIAKWNILFDKKSTEWISFKPKLGKIVYPCYACRNMFGSKNSFMDHVNRRAILLKYKCSYCTHQDLLTFYNPCSLLLHTRKHYTISDGQINLEHLEVSVLPYGLAGFLPVPSIPLLYDVHDDNVGETTFINSRFYSPVSECMGNAIVNLFPNELLFYCSDESTGEIKSLGLKQLSANIPRCAFVLLENDDFEPLFNMLDNNGGTLQAGESYIVNIRKESQVLIPDTNNASSAPVTLKTEPIKELPVELTKQPLPFTKCPECHQAQNGTMSEHFLLTNKPFMQNLHCTVCKYIAPTACSLQAHERIHQNISPFVCPECGRDFPHWKLLHEHMHDVCFHLTKQVRIRCSGKRCGKIFAQNATFSSHFLSHVKVWLMCTTCNAVFCDEPAFLQHNVTHEIQEVPTKVFKCLACIDSIGVFTKDSLQDHIRQHAVNKLLYVYICKSCHSYFRSPLTYATHLLRCTRIISPQVNPNLIGHQQEIAPLKMYVCPTCKVDIAPQLLQHSHLCPNCGSRVNLPTSNTDSDSLFETDQMHCPLCDQKLRLSDIEEHTRSKCRYSKPIIALNNFALTEHSTTKQEIFSPKSDVSNGSTKKRKRLCKNRNLSASNSDSDLNMDVHEIIPFDGTYRCKLCNYSNEVRDDFHKHVISHRNIATSYQCMECGECFVVKPSLSKHLLFYHDIKDIEKYFEQNNCFDRQSIQELDDMMHEIRGTVDDNQCSICFRMFEDNVESKKHFRTHGMAFLIKNSL